MTIDELERELKQLAEPEEADEQLRLALRADLSAQLQARRRLRVSRRLAFGLAAAAATCSAAVAVLVGTNGSAGPGVADAAIIHRAIAATSPPPNTIFHFELTDVQNRSIATEWWQETSSPYATREVKGQAGQTSEWANDGTYEYDYDASSNTIYRRPTGPLTFMDPISQIRRELQNGDARVAGSAVIDGITLFRIDLPNRLVGYFDKSIYQPRYLDDPQRNGQIVRFRVTAYEYLPLTQANLSQLDLVTQHPAARVDTNPNDAPKKKEPSEGSDPERVWPF